jgi:hypothetical protein
VLQKSPYPEIKNEQGGKSMKKICIAVLIAAALFAGVTPVEALPGWWVPTDGWEDVDWTNIKDDFDALSARVDARDLRLSDLEETQYVFGLNMRVFDSRKMSWNVFANYSANRSKLDRVGVELTLKFGKSYEEKQIEELRAEIAELKALLHFPVDCLFRPFCPFCLFGI